MAETGITLSAALPLASPDWREALKRAVDRHNRDLGPRGWGEIVLIGNRLVVRDVMPGVETRLQETLDQLARTSRDAAERLVQMRDAAREDLKATLLRPRSF